jgi:IS1 family transposase
VKHKENGHLIEVEKRVIWGTEEEILNIIQQEGRGQTINTSYVESRNGNYRKDNKRLARRSACQSKATTVHDAQIDLLTGIYNFVDEN